MEIELNPEPPPGGPQEPRNPCQCGSVEHQRISNKNCPLYRPPKRNLFQTVENGEPVKESACTVKCSLHSFLHTPNEGDNEAMMVNEEFLANVEDAVERMNAIAYEGCRLLLAFVTHRLENGQQLPDLSFNANMRKFFAAVLRARPDQPLIRNRGRDQNGIINIFTDTHFAPLRPPDKPWIDGRNLGNLISNMARQFAVNCSNHLHTNIYKRLYQWTQFELIENLGRDFIMAPGEIKSMIVQKLANYLLDHLRREPGSEDMIRFPQRVLNTVPADTIEFVFGVVDFVQDRLYEVILGNQRRYIDVEHVKESWWEYVEPTRQILRVFTENAERVNNEVRQRIRLGRGLRLFDLLPVTANTARYIHITTDALYDLYPFRGERPNREQFRHRDNFEQYWQNLFRYQHFETNGAQSRRFGFSIYTDGVGLSIGMQRRADRMAIDAWGYDQDGIYHPLVVDADTTVVGVDGGTFKVIYDTSSSIINRSKKFIHSCSWSGRS